jgi:hypothetical protein
MVHEGGFHMRRVGASRVVFFRPDGREIPEVPRPPALGRDPAGRLVRVHDVEGLRIDSGTCVARWAGEAMDYGIALGVLAYRERRAGASAGRCDPSGV